MSLQKLSRKLPKLTLKKVINSNLPSLSFSFVIQKYIFSKLEHYALTLPHMGNV